MSRYVKSFSSGGKQTSTANQVISFENESFLTDNSEKNNSIKYNSVQYLEFETFGVACRIKFNDEDTIHWIDANNKLVVSEFNIRKMTILDGGVEYYYTAFAEK